MRTLFSKFATRLYLATALAASFVGFGTVVTPTIAQASDGDHYDQMRPNFNGMKFAPGKKWYSLKDELPARIVADVEEQTGKTLCKIEVSPGHFVSNLMVCPKDHARMKDASIGLLRPMLHTGNDLADWFDGNWAYEMQPSFSDVPHAKMINDMYAAYQHQERATKTVVAGNPTHINSQAAAKKPAAKEYRDIAINSKGELRRGGNWYVRTQTADATTFVDTRKIDGKKFRVFTRANGTQGYSENLKGIDTNTLVAYGTAPETVTPVVLAAAPFVATFPGFTAPATGFQGPFFGNEDARYMNDFYRSVYGDRAQLSGINDEPAKASPLTAWSFDSRFYDLPQAFQTAAVSPAPIMASTEVASLELRPSIDEVNDAHILPVINSAESDVKVGTVKRNGQTYTTLSAANGEMIHLATGRANKNGEFVRPWAPGGLVKAFRVEHKGKVTKYNSAKVDTAQMKSLMTFVQAELRAKQASRLALAM